MRSPSRLLRVLGIAGLLVSLFAATIAPAVAQDEGASQDWLDDLLELENAGFLTGTNAIFYPWVANDDDFGLGPADTSISVQNLEDRDTVISIFVGDGNGDYDLVTSAYLSAYAAKTFHASQLGIAEGSGAPVAVVSFNSFDVTGFPAAIGVPEAAFAGLPGGTIALVETPIILSNPVADDEADGENDGGDTTQVIACVVNAHTSAQPNLGHAHGYVDAQTGAWVSYSTQQELQDTLNAVNAGNTGELINPFGGLNNDGDCFDVLEPETLTFDDSVAIGGVAKQAVEGETLPYTTSADSAVSGYNAINGVELAQFDEWYLPIVQTNCGPGGCWDSILRVANYDSLNNAVTIRFFPADDGSGSLQTGFQVQALVNGGDTWHVNLGDYVPDGWVGSAHILSDGAVFAMVDRYKVGYNMWITNTGSSADFENLAQVPGANGRYALFAPHVLLDYFGWNTGINVANLVNADNTISIQYFNLFGNATQVLNQRLAAHGMTYFYDPSIAAQDLNQQDVTSDPNAGVVGSAIIWSDYPVAAAVDATKYPETDPNGGPDLFQATSYSATANVFPWQAVPLVQKGSPADGMGDTSGINILNPNATAATANVYWVNPSGFLADNFGVSSVTIPGFANGFVYTLWQHNLPNGFLGAAQVVSTVPVAAVSANVNYEVDGDGSAIYNAFNPCGLYRVGAACSFGDVFAPGGQSVTKTFLAEGFENGDDIPVAGVTFSIASTSGANYQRDGVSGVDGSTTFTNVPVGVYELTVTSVSAGYVLPVGVQETFVVTEGTDVVLVNELAWNQSLTKVVCLAGAIDGDDDELDCEEPLAGVNVTYFEYVGDDSFGAPVAGAVLFTGVTGADGSVGRTVAVDAYIVCIWDADGVATTANGETVPVDLPVSGSYGAAVCDEPVEVDAGEDVTIFNPVDLTDGVLNIFVGTDDAAGTGATLAQTDAVDPVGGVEVCLYDDDDVLVACYTTDANGFVEFGDLPGGSYLAEVQADGYIVLAVDGGVLTVSNEDFDEDGVPVTYAVFTFDYNPTDDLLQDGWLDDVDDDGNLVGSIGLTIEVEESDAQLVEKTVTLNGAPVEGADVTIAVADGDGDIISDDTVETDSNGIATFVVAPGVYTVCSTVEVPTNADLPADGADQIVFPFTICDENVLVDETYEILPLTNEHVIYELTKSVQVLESCPPGFETIDECTFVSAGAGHEVTVATTDASFSATYETNADGEVNLTLPVSGGDAGVGNYHITSDVNGSVVEDLDFAVEDIVGGVLTNNHAIGQIDFTIPDTASADPSGFVEGDFIALRLFDADGEEPVTEQVHIDHNTYFAAGIDGWFFQVPEGTYRVEVEVCIQGVLDYYQDLFQMEFSCVFLGMSEPFEYSIPTDGVPLHDLEQNDQGPAGAGTFQALDAVADFRLEVQLDFATVDGETILVADPRFLD